MRGVLPFDPNLSHFAYVLLILAVLVAAIPLILFNWTSWLHSVDLTAQCIRKFFKLPSQARKDNKKHKKRQGGEEVRLTKAAWALKNVLALKRRILSHRYKKSDLRDCRDLEMGCGEPFMGSPKVESVLENLGLPSNSSFNCLPDPLSSLMGWDAPSQCE
jgi:hypothetical protein